MKAPLKVVAIVAVLAVAGGAVGYEVLTSKAPGNPCAGISTPTSTTAGASVSTDRNAPAWSAPGDPTNHGGSTGRDLWPAANGPINVVAGENFWGNLVSQLGGNQTSVTSIVSDPNADPHEYEANTSTATAFANAQYIIVNGVGYDDWALNLISADGNANQVILNVGELNGVTVGGGIVSGNPHMWYNPVYVNRTVAAMYSDLVSVRPSETSYFQSQYAALNASLASLYGRAAEIKKDFAGAVVASTESIFVYLANYTGLDLVSPPEFMEAVAEGNDPPTQSIVTFQCQLESGNVKVLVYNEQTVTPTTTSMKSIAAQNNVTIVGVTETIQPPDTTFQAWMGGEYLELQNALNANALGQ